MKKITLFCGALLVAASLLFVACGKDKEATINKFFKVENATLVTGDMPEPNSNQYNLENKNLIYFIFLIYIFISIFESFYRIKNSF